MTDQQDITQGELLPCPFCGGKAKVIVPTYGRIQTFVKCTVCKGSSERLIGKTFQLTIEKERRHSIYKWNTRVVNEENERLRAELDRYRAALEEISNYVPPLMQSAAHYLVKIAKQALGEK